MKSYKVLLLGVLFAFAMLTFIIGSTSAATHYVNPGDSIQANVTAANAGDTIIVRDGTYSENVIVGKRLTIRSENDSANCVVQAKSITKHVFEVNSNNVIIEGFTLKNATAGYPYFSAGVYLNGVNNCNISYNSITNNRYGITLSSSSSNNTLYHNEINDSVVYGLRFLSYPYYNSFVNNRVNGDYYYHYVNETDLVIEDLTLNAPKVSNSGKISLINCTNMTLINLTVTNNYDYGIYFYNTNASTVTNSNASNNDRDGIYLKYSNNNAITNNTANSNGNYQGIQLDTSSNNTIRNTNASYNGWSGIHIKTGSDNNWIEDCHISGNRDSGVYIYSENNTLKNNTISSNGYDGPYPGIWFYTSNANNNTLIENTINLNAAHGIFVQLGENNTIQNNTIMNNGYASVGAENSGIGISAANQTIKDNILFNNTDYGIDVNVGNQIITGNNISASNFYGIRIHTGDNDSLIYNNLFNNTDNFYLSPSASFWNTTKTLGINIGGGSNLGGNLWLLPNGTGFSQTHGDADSDDICDDPYTLNPNNVDYLPLKFVGTDTYPPEVIINAPENKTYGTSTIQINVSANDGSGIAEVIAQVDGTTNITLDNIGGYYLNTTTLDDGNHGIRIFAEDNAGNVNSDEKVNFTTVTAAQNISSCTIIDFPGHYLFNQSIGSTGTICINITSSDVVLDGRGFSLNGVGSDNEYGVYLNPGSTLQNVTVKNLTVNGWDYGIYLDNSQNTTIENNTVTNNEYGIYLASSSSNNTITDNNASSNDYGIYLDYSGGNTLRNNSMSGNRYNLGIDGGSYSDFDNDIDISNRVDGKPIYYLVGDSDTVINASSDAGLVYCINCSNITVKDATLANSTNGIFLFNTSNSELQNNQIALNRYGIYLWYSSDNNITDNNASTNDLYGIYLQSSSNNTLNNNSASNNYYGISLRQSSNSNTITNNTCSDNSNRGISIGEYETDYSCHDNVVYFNELYNNSVNNALDPTIGNHWNSTELMAYQYNGSAYTNYTGNYWSDYTGLDNDGNGIGDTPYTISGGAANKDWHPLIKPSETAPSISNILESDLTNNSITISWETDLASNNRIMYSTNEDLSGSLWSSWGNNTLSPSITISNLLGNTTYYYSCYAYSRDNSNLYSNSSTLNFTTIRDPVIWTVDDDRVECPDANFTVIQAAVNVSIDGDTILVYNGTYVENVLVDMSLNLTGGGRPEVDGNLTNDTIVLSSSGNIVQGFNITGAGYDISHPWRTPAGIRIGYTYWWYSGGLWHHTDYASTDNIIRDNNFYTNRYGIYLVKGFLTGSSNHNLITENNFYSNRIKIEGASYNNITRNNFSAESGVTFISIEGEDYRSASYNKVDNNTFIRNYSSTISFINIESYASNNNIFGNSLLGYGGIRVSSDRNIIVNNTIIGVDYLPPDNDFGIHIGHSDDCVINNNTVEYKNRGIYIETYSPYTSSSNITLRNNRLGNNTYNFFISPGAPDESTGSPHLSDFNHDIDATNTVNGEIIYYIKNASNVVYDQDTLPNAGFLACINCYNITVRDIAFSYNSHGILLYNTSDSLIENVYTHGNGLGGIALYNSTNVTINDSHSFNNGGSGSGDSSYSAVGVYLGRTSESRVDNCEIENNWLRGIALDCSHRNNMSNSTILDNGAGTSSGMGIRLYDSDENVIHSNTISSATPNEQKYGAFIQGSTSNSNTFYNNIFNNTINAFDPETNSWNRTKTPGLNIIGGVYLGGNCWHDYAGGDSDNDGLGDTEIPYNSSGKITLGGDYHPLTTKIANDTTAPSLYIGSPENNELYAANYVYLEVSSPDSDVNTWWYSLNSGQNVTFTPNTTITGLSNGDYSLVVYVNDTSGNTNSSRVNFTINVITYVGGGDGDGGPVELPLLEEIKEEEVELELTIMSPIDTRYTDRYLNLSYRSSLPLRRASYILDGRGPIALRPQDSTTIPRLSLGEHTLIVNGEDYYGKKGRAEVTFEIIPLTLGERYSAGTPDFPDEVSYSFTGRPVDYKLTFEVQVDSGDVGVYLNKHLSGVMGNNPVLVDYLEGGSSIGSLTPSSGWISYAFNISGEKIAPEVENIIAFIHTNNSNSSDELISWGIRNVTLVPLLPPAQFPTIEVFSFDKAISGGEELTIHMRIEGVADDDEIDAHLYVIGPDGKIRYYPDWDEEPEPVDSYYVRTSYYGRLPVRLEFNDSFTPGTYTLVGKLTEKGSTDPLSLSTEKVYYNNEASVKLYINRDYFTDGMEVVIEHALTSGAKPENGSLLMSIETPTGSRVFLPMVSSAAEGVSYQPVESQFSTIYEETIDSTWENGTYVVRSTLYNDGGDLIAEDIHVFDICRGNAEITGTFIGDISAPIVMSRIRLMDFYTLEYIVQRESKTEDQIAYSVSAPPGDYYLTGEFIDEDGKLYAIPLILVSLRCDEVITRNIELEELGEIDMESLGLETSGFLNILTGLYAVLLDEYSTNPVIMVASAMPDEPECSKPKVFVSVDIGEGVLNDLMEEYPGDTPSTLKRYYSIKYTEMLRINSPGVEINAWGEVLDTLTEQEQFLNENPGAEADLSKIQQKVNAEYLINLQINSVGERYVLSSNIYDPDLITAVVRAQSTGEILDSTLQNLAQAHEDVGTTINAWENTHPVPPRDPTISLVLTPESVVPEEGKNELTITARVTDCKGNPVRGTKVYFDEVTDRGYIKAETKAESYYSGYVYSVTDDEGIARATYVLFKGMRAGSDKVDIFTKGRGGKTLHQPATIKIAGLGIELTVEKSVLPPGKDTLIHIFLYQEDEGGEKTPLDGRMILVQTFVRTDSRILPLGPTDARGNPVTGSDGRATLRFIAGKKEGVVKIRALYQALGYEDSIFDDIWIEIKKDEYVILIDWKQNFEYTFNREQSYSNSWSNEECSRSEFSTHAYSHQGRYSYGFNSRTMWERASRSERTTASLTYNQNYDIPHSGSGGMQYTCERGSSSSSGGGSSMYSAHAGLTSTVRDVETKIIGEDQEGNLYIFINPIPLWMPITGQANGNWDYSGGGEYSSSSESGGSFSASWSNAGGGTKTATYASESTLSAWDRWWNGNYASSGGGSWSSSGSRSDSHSDDVGWHSAPDPRYIHFGKYSGGVYGVYFGPYSYLTGSGLPTYGLGSRYIMLAKTDKDSWEPFEHNFHYSHPLEIGWNYETDSPFYIPLTLNADIEMRVVKR